MPELPEVEVTRQGLLHHLLQCKVTDIHCSAKRLRLPIPKDDLNAWIKGDTITAIDRRAKYLLIRMHNRAVMVIHLGMTGRLGMFAADTPRAKHDHLSLQLQTGMEMRFNDTRRFGSIAVWAPDTAGKQEDSFNLKTGIEPLGPDFTVQALSLLANRRSVPVKNFLMNSKIVAGIGNIYANETLFAAGIHPEKKVNTLTDKQWDKVTTCCQEILHRAIAAGGSTISDFIGSSGKSGYFQLQLAVYGKKGAPCPGCGKNLKKTQLGGRATFFCSTCQAL